MWTGFIRVKTVACSCGCSDQSSDSMKDGEFLDWWSDYYLLKMDSTPWK
jgi:hypothetical protein